MMEFMTLAFKNIRKIPLQIFFLYGMRGKGSNPHERISCHVFSQLLTRSFMDIRGGA